MTAAGPGAPHAADFYLVDSADIISFEDIYRRLPGAALVAPAGDQWLDHERTVRYLAERGLPSQPAPSPGAAAVVGTQYHRSVDRPEYGRLPAIRMMYSLCEKGVMHGRKWCKGFEAILCPGPYSRRLLEEIGVRAIITGFPKYDAFLRGEFDRPTIRRSMGLDPRRRCILYLPTWSEHGSVAQFGGAIRELAGTSEYQVIYKPHTVTVRSERQSIDCFRSEIESGSLICIERQINMAELLAVADVVLTDGIGGAFWEAVIVTRLPVVAIHVQGGFVRSQLDAQYEHFAPTCDDPRRLVAMVAGADAGPYLEARAKKADDLLAHRDGTAARRAAEAIQQIIDDERGHALRGISRKLQSGTRRAARGALHLRTKALVHARNLLKGVRAKS